MSHKKILVAGDVMVDRYYEGPVHRVSPEAPVPVVHCPDGPQDHPGGAAHVATAAKALSRGVVGLIGDTGEDELGVKLNMMLAQHGVWTDLVHRPGEITPTKIRVTSGGRQLLRVDHEFRNHKPGAPLRTVAQRFGRVAAEVSVLVLSDYNKGTLPEYAVRDMIRHGQQTGVPVLADPKQRLEMFDGAYAVTPNWREAYAALAGTELLSDVPLPYDDDGTDEVAEELARLLVNVVPRVQHIVVTRGDHGVTWLDRHNERVTHLPAFSRCVYDVTGAGDVFIAGLAVGLAEDKPFATAIRMANTAAGISVNIPGTSTVGRAELDDVMDASAEPEDKIMAPDEAAEWAARRKASGQRVVLVNGCFDLMHPGHLHLLRSARSYGDKLVVAVNDDASVRLLKGPTRPFHELADRLAMLAAIGAVDAVVPFEEDTPERVIRLIKPDVLVKGDEYQGRVIPGADYVSGRGGMVRFVPMLPGRSTTALAAAMGG